jgi:hypothetical protein
VPKKLILKRLEMAQNSVLFRHAKIPLEFLLKIAVSLSLCTPINTSELLNRFLRNLLLVNFVKNCEALSVFNKIDGTDFLFLKGHLLIL